MLKNRMCIMVILLVVIGFSLNAQTELVQNGNFSSGTQNWSLGQYEGSEASASVVNGEYQIAVSQPGSAIWNVQLTQNGLNLEQGKTYVFSFDAYSGPENSGEMILNVNVAMADSPWSSYYGAQDNSITLQTEKTHYSFQFTMNEADEDNGRVEFNCGLSSGTVIIDNVSLSVNAAADYKPTSGYITDPESNIQFIRDIADFRANQRDDVNGGYFTHIDREGNPNGENIKALCGESRIAYTFVRAFMVTGDEAYLEKARHALKFLYDHGWNNGWYFVTDLEGNYISHWGHNDWWSFIQHYALLGISAMVEVTGGTIDWNDGAESDLTWLMRGVDSNFNNLWDSRPGYEGYFGHANTDWSNKWDKGFTPTVDGVTTHTLLMSMMYDDPIYDQRLVDLADNIMDYLVGNMAEAAVGFPEVFDADWNIDYSSNIMDVGHGYKTAWVLQRAYLMNPDHPEYLAGAQALMQDLWDNGGYDKEYGGPFAQMDWQTGEVTSDVKDFWMIEQGLTSGLISYYTASSQEQRNMYMQVADESMNFFMDHMVDPVYGEAYDKVSRDGSTVVNENKGGLFTAGYHSSEMSYYSMLYSSFYYHKSPVDLFYYYETEDFDRSYTLTPVPIEEGLLKILAVTLDGAPYSDFNSDTRTLNIPAVIGGKFKVTFGFGALITYTITASAENGGGISPEGDVSVRENGQQSFVFSTDQGYQIDDVRVDGVSMGPLTNYQFIDVVTDHTIEVFFSELPSYSITASAGDGGSITPQGTQLIFENDSAVFNFLPESGYRVADVVIDGESVGAIDNYQFMAVSADHTITVLFEEIPPVEYAINSGSSTGVLLFAADQFVTGGTTRSVTSTIDLTGVDMELQAPEALYQSERYGNSVYLFDGLVPGSDYSVRLHFVELYWTAANSRIFDVFINGMLMLDNLDIFAEAGAAYKALVKELSIVADANGEIEIEFVTETDNATIEGIEIFPALPNNPPFIVNEAAAEANPVAETSVALAVLADDDQGEALLTYSWAVLNAAPGSVSFSANQSNSAKNTRALFSLAGSYELEVTVSDSRGKSVTSQVALVVEQKAQRVELFPSVLSCGVNETQQFSASVYDQFDQLMTDVQLEWDVDGGSSVTSNGLFSAGPLAEVVTLSVSAEELSAQVVITIVDEPLVIYQINTGNNGAATPFSADQFGTGGSFYSVTNAIDLTAIADSDPAPTSVYQDERYGDSSYVIPGLDEGETYIVRLHFAELYWTSTGSRVFDVLINGVTVLENFDIFAITGAQYKAHIEEFTADATINGEITIDFVTITDNATIEGVEILK